MSFSTAIAGLPNAGKSTLFKALTQKQVAIAPYAFTTIEPNVAKVPVPDSRLAALSHLLKPPKTTPAVVEFIDVAGLVKNAYQGQGLGNHFLSHIQPCQAILLVLRGFENPDIEHPEKNIDPKRDIAILQNEFMMKDLSVARDNLHKLEKQAKTGSPEEKKRLTALQKIVNHLEKNQPAIKLQLTDQEKNLIKPFHLFTNKTYVYFVNSLQQEKDRWQWLAEKYQPLLIGDAKLESELAELSRQDKEQLQLVSLLDQIIKACYNALNLITFYTVAGQNEIRAWPVNQGTTALAAAAMIHTDFAKNFVKAEVVEWDKLVAAGSWSKAREKGMIKTVGKEYEIRDGDVLEFKI